eukprot:CAMPEP_0198566782 /NCGR_PEP_ID=MMETSP1462-20131121/103811_1 /TAXON_ID=1333877 /ORGANISM="Brandtodinium nutriculum, Strain RCC3387" /LENGTH=55 /DNA_ID=CAMNT_0044297819 /DNA_START=85 /DNA_END=248 /DNA_ORIENTATION=+
MRGETNQLPVGRAFGIDTQDLAELHPVLEQLRDDQLRRAKPMLMEHFDVPDARDV